MKHHVAKFDVTRGIERDQWFVTCSCGWTDNGSMYRELHKAFRGHVDQRRREAEPVPAEAERDPYTGVPLESR